jgi:choline kinase
MVRSLTCAAPWLESGDTLVSYSDIAFNASAVERLAAATGDIAITYDRQWATLWSGRFEAPLDDAETFRIDRGRVVEIGGRPESLDEIEGQFMGLLRFSAAGWQRISGFLETLEPATVDRLDMTGLLARLIAAGETVEGVAIDGGWVEVDSESDLAYY